MRQKGRPTLYTEELADEICDIVSSSSEGLEHLCKARDNWPARQNIYIWLRKYPDFRSKYTQAKRDQTEAYVDHIHELMNDDHHFVDDKGNIRVDSALLRLKIDTLKWHVGKLNPKVYGKDSSEDKESKQALVERILDKLVE